MTPLRGVLFDKDGTLFDFQATWGGWTAELIRDLTEGAEPQGSDLAEVLGVNRATRTFQKESPLIAGDAREIVRCIRQVLPHLDRQALYQRMLSATAEVRQVPTTDLPTLFADLRTRGLRLGIATNDAEAPARAHMDQVGGSAALDFLAGCDSGHGAKPDPGMLLAFCSSTGLAPAEVVMVGDSTHDLRAAGSAGMFRLAVLTGPAERTDLEAFADDILPSIADLPAWLENRETVRQVSRTDMPVSPGPG